MPPEVSYSFDPSSVEKYRQSFEDTSLSPLVQKIPYSFDPRAVQILYEIDLSAIKSNREILENEVEKLNSVLSNMTKGLSSDKPIITDIPKHLVNLPNRWRLNEEHGIVQWSGEDDKKMNIRTNNPMNLNKISNYLRPGELPINDPYMDKNHKRYKLQSVFSTPQDGINANVRDLMFHKIGKGINTITKIVNKWAPKEDGNDVEDYINFVSKRIGVDPNVELDYRNEDLMVNLVKAKINKEGAEWEIYGDDMIRDAVRRQQIDVRKYLQGEISEDTQ